MDAPPQQCPGDRHRDGVGEDVGVHVLGSRRRVVLHVAVDVERVRLRRCVVELCHHRVAEPVAARDVD